MVLVALLGGGDYAPEGLPGFGELIVWTGQIGLTSSGPAITSGLAHSGLSDFLKLYITDPIAFKTELSIIHERMIDELRTNSCKQLGRKYPQRAAELATREAGSLFPHVALDAYLRPHTSPLHNPTQGWPGFGRGAETSPRGRARNDGRGDLEGMAKACEQHFEWGTRELVSRKFAGENVGLFGAEIIHEARERVRSVGSMPRARSAVQAGPSSQTSSPTRINSYFSSALPVVPFAKNSSPGPSRMRASPPHIVKIHSMRNDPINPELREYRISYKPDIYVARCHAAMEGTRIDPKDLPLTERQALRLVDRETGDDEALMPASQAQSFNIAKSEIRVWVSEYLVREAWPELVDMYEEELRAKSQKVAKVRLPRKASAKPRTSRRVKASPGENTEAFVEFFTQRPRRSSPIEVEEVEEIEEQRSDRRSNSVIDLSLTPSPHSSPIRQKLPSLPEFARKLSRPRPSSSLTGVGSEKPHRELLKPSRVVGSSSLSPAPRARAQPRTKTLRILSSPSSPILPMQMLVRAVSTTSGAKASSKGRQDEPIDLCSSDDEVPQTEGTDPRIQRLPAPSAISPTKMARRATRKPKKAASDASQRRLDLPVVAVATMRGVGPSKGSFLNDPVWDA